MSLYKFNPRTLVLFLFIAAVAGMRVLFNLDQDTVLQLSNYSPVAAMALFGGAYFNRGWKSFVFPVGMLLLSDLLLHATVFKQYGNGGFLYEGWYWVYGAIALMVAVGRLILRRGVTAGSFLLASLVAVFIHWIVTDIPVWYGSGVYAQTTAGFMECLTAAIPFELRLLGSTLGYGILMFGSFEILQRRNAGLQEARG